jgi:hypothetical protein
MITSADSPFGRAFGNVAERKPVSPPERNFASRLPAVFWIVIDAKILVFQHRVMGGSSSTLENDIDLDRSFPIGRWTLIVGKNSIFRLDHNLNGNRRP